MNLVKAFNIILLIFLLFLFNSCKEKTEILTSKIIYDVYISPVEIEQPHVNYLSPKKRQEVLKFVTKAFKTNKVTDSIGNIITIDNLSKKIYELDTNVNAIDNASKLLEKFILDQWDVIRFEESWEYNKNTGQIFKAVKNLSFMKGEKDSFMMPTMSKHIFSIDVANIKMKKPDLDKSYVIYDVCIIPLVESTSAYYHNISLSSRQKYFTDLFNAVRNNKAIVLDYFYEKIPRDKISDLFVIKGIEEFTNKEISIPISIEEIGRIKFIEQWYWDTSNLTLNKYVFGVNPGLQVRKEDDLIGFSPLFWAIFNKKIINDL